MCYRSVQHVSSFIKKLQVLLEDGYEDFELMWRNRLMC